MRTTIPVREIAKRIVGVVTEAEKSMARAKRGSKVWKRMHERIGTALRIADLLHIPSRVMAEELYGTGEF